MIIARMRSRFFRPSCTTTASSMPRTGVAGNRVLGSLSAGVHHGSRLISGFVYIEVSQVQVLQALIQGADPGR